MNIKIARGEQLPLTMSLKDDESNNILPTQLTEITMTCRKLPIKESQILFQKKLSNDEITYDVTSSEYVINLLEEDTKNLSYGQYGFDIKIEIDDVIEKFVGSLTITEEYTMGYDNEQN